MTSHHINTSARRPLFVNKAAKFLGLKCE